MKRDPHTEILSLRLRIAARRSSRQGVGDLQRRLELLVAKLIRKEMRDEKKARAA